MRFPKEDTRHDFALVAWGESSTALLIAGQNPFFQ